MTYREALEEGNAYLAGHEIQEASVDAWYLMEHVCGMNRTQYLMRMREPMPEADYVRYQSVLAERAGHVPLQHITGEQEFMGMPFRVSDKVLIPRQDTEILVEETLKVVKPGMHVLDLCTGSGCILISLLRLCPGLAGTGTDVSPEALAVAEENARRLDVKADLIESDLFERIHGMFDVIVSNPPYIPTGVIGQLMAEVRLHDPMLALDGKKDGLYFYRRIVQECDLYLKRGGWLLFEIGHDQGEQVTAIMRAHHFTGVRVVRDLAGLDRVVLGKRS